MVKEFIIGLIGANIIGFTANSLFVAYWGIFLWCMLICVWLEKDSKIIKGIFKTKSD